LSSKKSLNEILEKIVLEVEKVKGAAAVAEDGVVLADLGLEDSEGIGAISVFIGMAGNFIGQTLGVGKLLSGMIVIEGDKLLVFNMGNFQIGVLIEAKASARFAVSEITNLLETEYEQEGN
jgi:predicted regulator of Ras-like GTPase activity (Roadblock/LC7/MglB family)